MPFNKTDYMRGYMHEYRKRHGVINTEYDRRYEGRASRYAVVDDLKSKPCTDCGRSFPAVCMDFDHRDPSSKVLAVSHMVSLGYSLQRILDEIDKCDLVCANCHRVRTHLGARL